ncbi:MAG: type I-U CRISPR-associated protein Csx17 [Sandaracinaceae bacterium]
MHEHVLRGCQPEPLGSYLKALGILRLVAEQKDPAAAGWWTPEGFVLRTELDEPSLLRFFTEEYEPSPVANPWNGAGGFYFREDKKTGRRTKATTATKALAKVKESKAARLASLRAAVEIAERCVAKFGFEEAPKNEDKAALVNELRDRLPDAAVAWLDAVLVVDVESLGFPPVLGTGGTEGNLDFASNFYQRLDELTSFESGAAAARSETTLRAAMFGESVSGMAKAAIGQFDPGGAGGGNAAPGFEGNSLVNPWDFVLIIEGTLLLASATTRKMEQASRGSLVFPFSVRAVGADYASSSGADEGGSRNELWLPLWQAPTGRTELARLFGEGRADVQRRRAVHAVDFARAVGSLGVDRGIAEFARFGFHQRNGKSYFATPLGRWQVQRNPDVDLIDPALGRWMDALRRVGQGNHAPASWGRVIKAVERAVFELARAGTPQTVQGLLVALAAAEGELSLSPAGREAIRRPIPPLDQRWLERADDGSDEHDLARALATTAIRERITWARWRKGARSVRWSDAEDHRTVWGRSPLVRGVSGRGV